MSTVGMLGSNTIIINTVIDYCENRVHDNFMLAVADMGISGDQPPERGSVF